MTVRDHEKQLPVPDVEDDAIEILRLWTTRQGSSTLLIDAFPFSLSDSAGIASLDNWGSVIATIALTVVQRHAERRVERNGAADIVETRETLLNLMREAFIKELERQHRDVHWKEVADAYPKDGHES